MTPFAAPPGEARNGGVPPPQATSRGAVGVERPDDRRWRKRSWRRLREAGRASASEDLATLRQASGCPKPSDVPLLELCSISRPSTSFTSAMRDSCSASWRSSAVTIGIALCLMTGEQTVDAQIRDNAPQPAAATGSGHEALNWILPAAFIGSTLAIPSPDDCRWCDRDSAGHDSLNRFDRSVRSSLLWSNTEAADLLSSVAEFSPIALLVGLNRDDLRETALPVFRAFGTNYLVTHVVKIAAARQRPVVHFGGTVTHGANASFFSGHSSDAFSLVFALARVNSDRHDPKTKWVWIAGVPLAALTAYLRVAADKHYATDVLMGAGVGAAIGWTTPGWWGHSARSGCQIVPAASPGGANLRVTWRW